MVENEERQGLDIRHTIVHTNGMKIAISIPESVFREVKKLAEKQKRSRSEIFVEAVREYLKRLESRRILDSLNEVYSSPETQEELDARAAALDLYKRTVLEKEKW
jgi:metal-responsive CopG/Arc/MetJ family transcriptional regulator